MSNNLKNSVRLLIQIEKNYFDEFQYEKINYWPILRLILWKNLTKSGNIKVYNKQLSLIIKIIKWLIYNIKNYFVSDNYFKNSIFFFGVPTAIVNVKKNNKRYDRIFDPILKNLSKKKYKKVYFNNSFISNLNMAYPINGINCYYNLILKDYKVPIELEVLIYKISKNHNLDVLNILYEFRNEFNNLTTWYLYTKKFLKKYTKIRKVFFYPWYASNSMGIILALKEKGIETIDIQHGEQGSYQGMYTHWKKVPQNGFNLLPDYFYCWKKKIIEIHNKSSNYKFKLKHKSLIFKDYWGRELEKGKIKKINNSKIVILFCLQPYTEKSESTLIPDFFIEYMNKNLSRDIKIIIRIHPNDKKIIKHLKKKISGFKFKDMVSIDVGKFSLYDSFSEATHCLSKSSTATIQALNYGLKSAFFGKEVKEKFSYVLRDISFLDHKKNNLENWLFNTKT
jgi:hypothetical protein